MSSTLQVPSATLKPPTANGSACDTTLCRPIALAAQSPSNAPENAATPDELIQQLCASQGRYWANGQRVLAEAFFQQYPQLAGHSEAFTLVREEIRIRQGLGEQPSFAEYAQRFPQFVAQLNAQFPAAQMANAPQGENLEGKEENLGDHLPTRVVQRPPTPDKRRLSSRLPQVPGYQLLGVLGRGGMGVVYKARQQGLNRLVALKMIQHEAFGDLEFLGRFHAEAQAIARLQHPNIVQIYAVGTVEGASLPQPYIALEFIGGGDLRGLLKDNPQPPRQAAELLVKLARAIHYAHQNGIVHRDLKPGNILLTLPNGGCPGEEEPDGGVVGPEDSKNQQGHEGSSPRRPPDSPGEPKIVDFGLAKIQDASGKTAEEWTRQGVVLGTPAYMAPEQAAGEKDLTASVDVYALGVILYECLTGRVPFEGVTALDTMDLVRQQKPIAPRQLHPRIPQPLETICLKCLEKEPARRYATAEELADDLQRFLNGEPIRARPASPLEHAWRWTCRRPVVAALLGLVLLVSATSVAGITGALVYALAGWQAANEERLKADQRRQEADRERERAQEEKRIAHKQRLRAMEEKRKAAQAATRAERERARAEAEHEQSETSLYFSRIAQARLERELYDIAGSNQLLRLCVPAAGKKDRRGWEWYYLNQLNQAGLANVQASGFSTFSAVQFSPNGHYLAIAAGQIYTPRVPGMVLVWDQTTGEFVYQAQHLRAVTCLSFSRDGKWLASGDVSGGIQVYDLNKRQVRTWKATGAVRDLDFAPDGRLLVANGKQIDVWNLASKQGAQGARPKKTTWPQKKPALWGGVAFSPDGTHAAIRSGWAYILDGRTGQRLHAIPKESDHGRTLAFSPDGHLLALANRHKALVVEVSTGKQVVNCVGHSGDVMSVAFSPDGLTLATGGADRTVRVWDVRTGDQRMLLRGHTGRVTSVAFHPQGYMLASGSEQPSELKLWDLTGAQEHTTITTWGHSRRAFLGHNELEGLRFTPDSQSLITVDRSGFIHQADANSGVSRVVASLPILRRWFTPATLASFTRDGQRVAALDYEDVHKVKIHDLATTRELAVLSHRVPVHRLAFGANGKVVATVGNGKENNMPVLDVTLWDVENAVPRMQLRSSGIPAYTGLLGALALSIDGTRLAFDQYNISPEGISVHIAVCDTTTGKILHRLQGHRGILCALAFSTDGTRLASVDGQGQWMVWDVDTGKKQYPQFQSGATGLHALAFHPSGSRLAGVTREHVHLWDVPTGQELMVLRGARPRCRDDGFNPLVAWSPDGRWLAASNWQNRVNVWSIPPRNGEGSGEVPDFCARSQAMKARIFDWHLQALPQCTRGSKGWALHLQALLAREPEVPAQRLARGELLARLGRWKAAAADLTKGTAEQVWIDQDTATTTGFAQLAADDIKGYRKTCLAHYEGNPRSGNLTTLVSMGWMLSISRDSGISPAQLTELVKHWKKHMKVPPAFLALAAYRDGRYREALALVDQEDQHGKIVPAFVDYKPMVFPWVVRALSHRKLGNQTEAERWLKKANDWYQKKKAASLDQGGLRGDVPPGVSWRDRVTVLALLRQASE